MGSSDSGRLGQIIMLAFNITLYLAEHWTRSFPGLSQFVYDVHLHEFSVFMMLSFFYFSYYNSGKHQSLVRNWFFATLIFMWINASLDIGMPKKTMEEQIKYIEGDEVYNIAHFIGHVFLFVMAWHVSSVVDVTNGLKKGWIVENEKIREWVKSWNEPAESPKNTLKVSLAVCGVAAAIAVVIEILEATFDGSVPMYPQPCRAVVTNDDQCSFLGISIPCHRVFHKEALNHFGVGLEMEAVWTFLITFIIGLVSLCMIRDWNWKSSSLKISCACYGIETAFFALIRYYWGVCKPLVGELCMLIVCTSFVRRYNI